MTLNSESGSRVSGGSLGGGAGIGVVASAEGFREKWVQAGQWKGRSGREMEGVVVAVEGIGYLEWTVAEVNVRPPFTNKDTAS